MVPFFLEIYILLSKQVILLNAVCYYKYHSIYTAYMCNIDMFEKTRNSYAVE